MSIGVEEIKSVMMKHCAPLFLCCQYKHGGGDTQRL